MCRKENFVMIIEITAKTAKVIFFPKLYFFICIAISLLYLYNYFHIITSSGYYLTNLHFKIVSGSKAAWMQGHKYSGLPLRLYIYPAK